MISLFLDTSSSYLNAFVVKDSVINNSIDKSEEGFKDYKMLYELGVNLIFLNEPLINTSIFDSTKNNLLEISVQTGNSALDDYFKGNISLINNLLMALAEEQIKSAFLQAEKEVTDLHTRISQGMRESKKNGKKIGLEKGTTLVTEKSVKCKEIIKKHALDFGGMLSDSEVMTLCGISRNSYYKYKRELKLQNSYPCLHHLQKYIQLQVKFVPSMNVHYVQ